MDEKLNIKVFISHAHNDHAYFEVFKDTLKQNMKTSTNYVYEIWDDRNIYVGNLWDDEIQNNLKTSNLALLLVSDSFLASDYIKAEEFGRLIEQHQQTLIIPIMFAPCDFTQWDDLARRQFFMPQGNQYGKATQKDFTFADLVKFCETDGKLIPNTHINRYIRDMVNNIERSLNNFIKIKKDSYNIEQSEKNYIVKGSRCRPDPLFGYNKNINAILKELEDRSIAIVGISGIGKSKVVSAVLERIMKDKQRFQFKKYYWKSFYDYKNPPSFSIFGSELIKELLHEEIYIKQDELTELVQLVIRTINELQCFLVIDQFEVVIDRNTRKSKEGYDEFLFYANQGFESARLLITSWETPLDSKGRSFFINTLEGIDNTSGMQLITYMSKDKTFISREKKWIEGIISKLQGHPFALELIAKNYKIKGVLEYVERSFFKAEPEKIVAVLYEGLPINLKEYLNTVCIFSESCNLEAIAFVLDISKIEAFEAINELMQRAIVLELDEGQYNVHILIREYVLSKLLDEEKEHFHNKATDYYRERIIPRCPPHKKRTAIEDIYPYLNYIDHLISANKPDEAVELFEREKIHENLHGWSYFAELKCIYERFEEKKEKIQEEKLGIVYSYFGVTYRDLDDNTKAKEYYERSLIIAKKYKNKHLECTQYERLGDLYFYLNKYDESLKCHRKVLDLMNDIEDRKLEARNLGGIGNVLRVIGELQEAEDYYNQAIDIFYVINHKRDEGIYRGNLGVTYADYGNISVLNGGLTKAKTYYEQAIDYYKQAIALAKETGDRKHENWWLGVSSQTYCRLGNTDKAINNLKAALMISEKIYFRRGIIFQLEELGNIYLFDPKYHNFSDAVDCFEKLLDFYPKKEDKDRKNEKITLWKICLAFFALNKYAKAITYFKKFIRIEQKVQDSNNEIFEFIKNIVVPTQSIQFDRAKEFYKEAISITERYSIDKYKNYCKNNLCDIYLKEAEHFYETGQEEEAFEQYSKAIELGTNSAEVYYRAAVMFYNLGRKRCDSNLYQKGIENYKKTININESNTLVYAGIADCYALKGNLEEAILNYNKAIDLDHNNTSAILSKMEVELWAGKYENTTNTYRKWHKKFTNPMEKVIASWIICIAHALLGRPYAEYMDPLTKFNGQFKLAGWNISDIEPYFKKLDEENFPSTRLEKALEIHHLLKTNFINAPDE